MYVPYSGDTVTRVTHEIETSGFTFSTKVVGSRDDVASFIFERAPDPNSIICYSDGFGLAIFFIHVGVARRLRCCCNGYQPFTEIGVEVCFRDRTLHALVAYTDGQPANGLAVKRGIHTLGALLTTKQLCKALGI